MHKMVYTLYSFVCEWKSIIRDDTWKWEEEKIMYIIHIRDLIGDMNSQYSKVTFQSSYTLHSHAMSPIYKLQHCFSFGEFFDIHMKKESGCRYP